MAEIKSTLEIIMEKAKGLTITHEEKREFRRKEMTGRVKGLIQKFLDGYMDDERLRVEVAAVGKEDKDMLKQILIKDSISRMKPGEDNKPVLDVLENTTGEDMGSIRGFLTKFDSRLEKERSSHEKALRKRLKKNGITGSAVIPNLDADPEWRGHLLKQKQRFREKLEDMAARRLGRRHFSR